MKTINILVCILCNLLGGFLLGAYFLNHIDGLTFFFTFGTALFCAVSSLTRA
jgi:hypothetical protein